MLTLLAISVIILVIVDFLIKKLKRVENNSVTQNINKGSKPEKPLPCPICGSTASFHINTFQHIMRLSCDNPHCPSEILNNNYDDNCIGETQSLLIKTWNTRKS